MAVDQRPSSAPEDIGRVDRDLSWLEFNSRVLHEALDERTPLLERVKFLAIFSSNLDEFFMKRIAIIRPQEDTTGDDLEDSKVFLRHVRRMVTSMNDRQAACFADEIRPQLAAHGIRLLTWEELDAEQRREVSEIFDREISPVLTPLGLDAVHPFPFVSNLSTSWAFRLDEPEIGETVFVRVKVPGELRQWVRVRSSAQSQQRVYVELSQIIAFNAHKLFPGLNMLSATLFRVCRDAEVELDDDSGSKRAQVERELKQRRFEPVVRLEIQPGADPAIVAELTERFGLTSDDVYETNALIDYTTLYEIANIDLPELHDPPWIPIQPVGLEDAIDIFAAIRSRDILLHQPYDSFYAGVERFISDAADDPQTLSIKMTVYRVGDDTPFVRSLMRAAEAGKQVACVIELNARFDEARNLHWSRELEKVGAHVIFGVRGLKTHSKAALVVRNEEDGIRCYAHVATGNYHTRTARLYEDVGLLTANPAITTDIVNLFHFLTGRARTPRFENLLVAPIHMRTRFEKLIEQEIENRRSGLPARIVCKMNQLEDEEMCRLLIGASCAGVPIDLIVRGVCCLAPGIPGLTENIRIRSIVGRFLEHSRIFHFAAGTTDPLEGTFVIGSADWMHRNLSERVEAATPILDRRLRFRLWQILEICLADNRSAWEMNSDGSYRQIAGGPHTNGNSEGTHSTMMQLARRRHTSIETR